MAYIHQINSVDIDNSFQEPGYRFSPEEYPGEAYQYPVGVVASVFFNFCSFHCKECWNEKTWDRQEDLFMEDEEVARIVLEALDAYETVPPLGLSLLGGDPIVPENAKATAHILSIILEKKPYLVIGSWTGYTWSALYRSAYGSKRNPEGNEDQRYILEHLDVLIDSPFILKRKIKNRRYGSDNQRVLNVPASLKAQAPICTESYNKENRITE